VEQRALKRLVLAGALVALAGAATWVYASRGWRARDGGPAPSGVQRIVPRDTRIRVEVLNGTEVRGLARRASLYLRDLGFDVVRFDQDSITGRSTTLVLDRTSHPEWARMLSEAMTGSRVEERPDTSRYVDITVLVGANWRPPPKALYP
jgi:LytR cell envelope-related transcriptional attenuator